MLASYTTIVQYENQEVDIGLKLIQNPSVIHALIGVYVYIYAIYQINRLV